QGSWAVSFGMPSKSPDYWRRDVTWTRDRLAREKILSVSVVGTTQPGWTIDDLADDYARCAKWALESGADVIEANFSCPNVSTCDGQLYQEPSAAACVASRIRQAIGETPFLLKVGYFADLDLAATVLDAVAPYVSGWASTNSVIARVRNAQGEWEFDGAPRGICGDATRSASVAQTAFLSNEIQSRGYSTQLIGVGGVSTTPHVREFLAAGAEGVHLATSVMVDPAVGLEIRRTWQNA
ncbi:MAG: dihydroorotate dehydrogenase, partial [Planctomycetaceae bacterium]